MKSLTDHHDGTGAYGSGASGKSIVGRFFARLWDLDCVLELHPDNAGLLKGSFIVDGEQLEITGALLGPRGEVRGIIRAHNLADAFAAFQARLDEDGLFLEVNVTDAATGLETARRVIFVRLG